MATVNVQAVIENSAEKEKEYARPLVILSLLLLVLAICSSTTDIFVTHLQSVFDLNKTNVLLLESAVSLGYLLFSLPAARLLGRLGYQLTIGCSLITMAVGSFLFVPAMTALSYPLLAAALAIFAVSVCTLQVAVNPFVVVLGKPATASSRLCLAQGIGAMGAVIAPKLASMLLFTVAPLTTVELLNLSPDAIHFSRIAEAASLKVPCILMGSMLMLLAVGVASVKFPSSNSIQPPVLSCDSVWQNRNLVFGAIGIFACVGAEVSVGRVLLNYFSRSGNGSITTQVGTGLVALYGLGLIVGRFLGAALLRKTRTSALVTLSAIGSSTLLLVSILAAGRPAMWSLVAVGLSASVIFPCIFAISVEGLGSLIDNGSGVLIMAMSGGAIIPLLQESLSLRIALNYALVIPLVCYLYVLFLGLRNSRLSSAGCAE